MPWHVSKSDQCPADKPWAVIKDGDSSVVACHLSKGDANKQLAALYANDKEGKNSAPVGDKAARGTRELGNVRREWPVQLEVRNQANGVVSLSGYASATEAPYEMWDMFGAYTEVVRAGAFTKTLSENPATQLLLNHGGLSMAYTRAGTLRLSEDSSGLHMSADVNTSRTDVRDMLTAIEDGNIDEMSFAFRITRQQWAPDFEQVDLHEVDVHRGDVSVVNFGANPATTVALRGLDFDRLGEDDTRALIARLQRGLPAPPAAEHPLSLYAAIADAL